MSATRRMKCRRSIWIVCQNGMRFCIAYRWSSDPPIIHNVDDVHVFEQHPLFALGLLRGCLRHCQRNRIRLYS